MDESREFLSFTAQDSDEGLRLDVWLSALIPDISRSQIVLFIENGFLLVNGLVANKKQKIHTGDSAKLSCAAIERLQHPLVLPENIPLNKLYEDEYLVAINKPAGLVIHPGNGNAGGTLVNALLHEYDNLAEGFTPGRPGIIHRLDKDTTGVVLVAKSTLAHAAMAKLFANRLIHKEYLGFCIGDEPHDHDEINSPLGRSNRDPIRRSIVVGGREALTEYWNLSFRVPISLVKFRLHTGRTHQIRVHCHSKGFPIIGDALYGRGAGVLSTVAPLHRAFAARIVKCFTRQALHAWRISFEHPMLGTQISIAAPIPEDFLAALGEWKNADPSAVGIMCNGLGIEIPD